MPQLLLEIFSEEIPARMQPGAARDLERMASDRLKAAGLSWEALTTYAGPRRLTLVVEGLPAATPDRSEEIKGPKVSAPEQALEGFLRKTGLTREQLVERDGVLFAVIDQKGRSTTDLIPDMVEDIIKSFPWPKSMHWGDGTLRWVRPIKRIVCLFDGQVVPFLIADGSPDVDGVVHGITSGDITEGHRFLGSGQPFAVRDFADYRRKLEEHFVLLDAADRRLRILEQAKAVCHAKGLELVDDDGLLEEVTGLAEWPTPILGQMDPAFLDLPPEVIRLSMKVHQKYFAVRQPGREGLAPNFVVVANIEASDGGTAVAAGNARVLSARLNDARFFWDEDRKAGNFDAWLEKLKGSQFHDRFGSLAERVARIEALARKIAPLVGADPEEAALAARYAKADLASGMVGEFPELQGIMGGYYLKALPPRGGKGGDGGGHPDAGAPGAEGQVMASSATPTDAGSRTPTQPSPLEGEGSALADAVRDHYKPQGPNDTVPSAPVTVAVALADKLDTLVGFFAIDEKPTGSKDPFALRRAALGVIRLALASGRSVGLKSISQSALDGFKRQGTWKHNPEANEPDDLTFNAKDANSPDGLGYWTSVELGPDFDQSNLNAVLVFFADRLKVLLKDHGRRHDLVDAVFALGDDDLVRVVRKVEALSDFLATEDGANLLAGYKRASNILRPEEKKGPLPTGAAVALAGAPPEETALIAAVDEASVAVDAALASEDFAAAMSALARLRAPVDAFLDAVLVNSDVPAERDNRLRLLAQVRAVMGQVADFSQIAG